MFELFSHVARVSVALAQEVAYELHTADVRPEHLLVGALQSAGHDLSSLLGGYGLTAEVIRDRLATADSSGDESFDDDAVPARLVRTFGTTRCASPAGAGVRRGHIPFTKPAKKVLELSLREALTHKDSENGCQDIVVGILRGGDKFTVGLITERVYASQLRGAIIEMLDKAA